jgi:hypothetical protein
MANPGDRVADHLEMAERLKPIRSDVVGYLYNRAPARSYAAHHGGPMARPASGLHTALVAARPPDDESRTVPQPRPR